MMIAAALICGFILDLLLGDPAWMPHPVIIIGKCITHIERLLRRFLPKTHQGELAGGVILTVCIAGGTLAVTLGICMLAAALHPLLGFAVQVLWSWQALAVKGLKAESFNVYRCLESADYDLDDARHAVGRIVGRDTGQLSRKGVIKATVETVAENFSDGVLAPMFYLAIGGAPLGMMYKAVNTMDSMVGYKNDEYLYFGRAAARLDDAAGYIPSRIAALFFIASAFAAGGSTSEAWRIWRRDRRNHASPNSAQTEAACAGALGIQLAGPAYYFGKYYDKPTIGDAGREAAAEDIRCSVKMMYAAGIMAVLFFAVIRIAVFM